MGNLESIHASAVHTMYPITSPNKKIEEKN